MCWRQKERGFCFGLAWAAFITTAQNDPSA